MRRKLLKIEWLWLTALLLLVSAHFWFPRTGTGTASDTYATTAEGKKAFYLLIEQHKFYAERTTEPLSMLVPFLDPEDTLCLLGPSRLPTDDEWDKLLNWVSTGGSLVIAVREDHDSEEVEFDRLNVVLKHKEKFDDGDDDGGNDDDETTTTMITEVSKLKWQSSREIVAEDAETLVEQDGTTQAVSLDYHAGRIVIVASDFVFTNQSLAWEQNSVLAYRLLEAAGSVRYVYFDESLNISGTPKVVGLLLDPFLRPMTIQLLIGLLVFAWWQSRRFGPLLPRSLSARHNIVAHTDAVGVLHYRSKDCRGALRGYLRQLFAELRIRSFKGREERVLMPIARRMGKDVREIKQELAAATKALRSGPLDRTFVASCIRRLAEIRQAAKPADVHPTPSNNK